MILLSYFREIHSAVAGFCDGADFKPHCYNPCIYFVSGEYQYLVTTSCNLERYRLVR